MFTEPGTYLVLGQLIEDAGRDSLVTTLPSTFMYFVYFFGFPMAGWLALEFLGFGLYVSLDLILAISLGLAVGLLGKSSRSVEALQARIVELEGAQSESA